MHRLEFFWFQIKLCTSTELFFAKLIVVAIISLCQSSNKAAFSVFRGNICRTEYRGRPIGRENRMWTEGPDAYGPGSVLDQKIIRPRDVSF